MVGVDKENNIVIIENKNIAVDEKIIPQILGYAFWVQSNPDSIKALWLELGEKPEDVEPDWDNIEVRIMVFAPEITRNIARLIKRSLNYEVDLIEIKRFAEDKNEFILVDKIEDKEIVPIRPTGGLENYDRKFYETNRNKNSVDLFYKLIDEVEKLAKKKGWKLEKKFTKYYCGFKYGFPNVFGVHWRSSKSLDIFFKIPETTASKIKVSGANPPEYQKRWKQVIVKIDSANDVKKLTPYFEAAYNYIIGKD
ncbi:MAG: hypothetical protein WD712_01855 [Candidatus Spechtbacterales bacterium]